MNSLQNVVHRGVVATGLVLIALALIGSGCSTSNSDDNGPHSSTGAGMAGPTVVNPPEKVAVYIPLGDANDMKDVIVHPANASVPGSPAKSALIALAADPDSGFPSGTHILGIDLKDGEAVLNFDQVPVNEEGGEAVQARTLNAILMTLGQFQSISTVQILVNGSAIKEAGELSLDTRLNVIRPDPVQQAQQPGGQERG